jgi:DNA-directed RNA polymerase specialized sigma24 family protein
MTRPVVTAAETDAALVEAARSGHAASYGLLVERYQSIAHRTAFALGAGDDTADVVQEAFVKAYLALDRFQVTEPFRPWILRIVVNETRNRWRWISRHRTVPLPLVGDDPTSAVPAEEQIAEGPRNQPPAPRRRGRSAAASARGSGVPVSAGPVRTRHRRGPWRTRRHREVPAVPGVGCSAGHPGAAMARADMDAEGRHG